MHKFLTAAMALMPFLVQAATNKTPADYSVNEYGIYLGVALLGGAVSWLNKMIKGDASALDLMRLVGELATSAFVGLIFYFGCEYFAVHPLLTFCIVALSGHMGTRALRWLERFATKVGAKHFGLDDVPDTPPAGGQP